MPSLSEIDECDSDFTFRHTTESRSHLHMPDTTSTTLQMREALVQIQPVAMAIPVEKLLKPKIDIAAAGSILLAALPRYESQIAELSDLKHIRVDLITELPLRAMAMVQAFAGFKIAASPVGALPDLLERAGVLRKQMLTSAAAVAAQRPELQESVDAIQRGNGHRDSAFDLVGLSVFFRRLPADVLARTFVTTETIDEAQTLGQALLTAVGEKAEGGPKNPDEVRLRDGTYTLFMESYNEGRRGLTYLHGEKVDTYLPSVFLRSSRAETAAKPGPVGDGSEGAGGDVVGPSEGGANDGTEPGGPFGPPL
jgi:hypothetical protein